MLYDPPASHDATQPRRHISQPLSPSCSLSLLSLGSRNSRGTSVESERLAPRGGAAVTAQDSTHARGAGGGGAQWQCASQLAQYQCSETSRAGSTLPKSLFYFPEPQTSNMV